MFCASFRLGTRVTTVELWNLYGKHATDYVKISNGVPPGWKTFFSRIWFDVYISSNGFDRNDWKLAMLDLGPLGTTFDLFDSRYDDIKSDWKGKLIKQILIWPVEGEWQWSHASRIVRVTSIGGAKGISMSFIWKRKPWNPHDECEAEIRLILHRGTPFGSRIWPTWTLLTKTTQHLRPLSLKHDAPRKVLR